MSEYQVTIHTIATSRNDSKLISLVEGNLDFNNVDFQREVHAVKIMMLTFIISVAGVYALEKFVLSPMIDPLAEKFNWFEAVKKYFSPNKPFHLIVNIHKEKIKIDTGLITNHEITSEIWKIIKKTIAILRKYDKFNIVSKVRFDMSSDKELVIVCYKNSKPDFIVDIENSTINNI